MQRWMGLVTSIILLLPAVRLLTSPCPSYFQYVSEGPSSWKGEIVLHTTTTIRGICINLMFDYFPLDVKVDGDLQTIRDNYHSIYDLVNSDLILNANSTTKFGITARYNERRVSKLIGFEVNGHPLCPEPTRNFQSVKGGSSKPPNQPTSNSNSNNKNSATNPVEAADCGVVPLHPGNFTHQRIHEGQFPWHAYLNHVDGKNKTTKLCSATLISPSLLLTAAHCLITKTGEVFGADLLQVNLGEHFTTTKGRGLQKARIARVATHPRFNRISWDNDVAIVKLDKPITITDYVRPVCLTEKSSASNEGFVTGIGIDSDRRMSDSLMFAKLLIFDRVTCLTKNPDIASIVSSKSLCAAYERGNTICVGEAGAGVVFLKNVWQLRALVSAGPSLQNMKECNDDQYIYLTDLSQYLGWIKTASI